MISPQTWNRAGYNRVLEYVTTGTGMSDGSDNQYDVEIEGFPTTPDDENLRGRLPVEFLAGQFVEEIRSGGTPSIDAYARKYSRLAAEIREYFPVLQAMEELKQKKQNDNLRESVPEEFDLKEIGGCRMLREIGRGGMGVVFEAVEDGRKTTDDLQVAVKLLPWHTAGIPGWRERFMQEAKTTKHLEHPNIVPIYRRGRERGHCYYIMKLVEGVGLDWMIGKLEADVVVTSADIRAASHRPRRVRDIDTDCEIPINLLSELENATEPKIRDADPITLHTWDQHARLILQAARALSYAHNRGVLHNDVKPGNLLIDDQWHVWMTDFGLAQRMDSPQSDDERLVGTLRYMAPERIRGEQTVQTDIYSLGLTLYELVTQTVAFGGDDRADLVQLILQQEPVAPRDINRAIPENLETVIFNAISPNPEQRYHTASEFEVDLVQFIKNQPIESRRALRKRFGFFRS